MSSRYNLYIYNFIICLVTAVYKAADTLCMVPKLKHVINHENRGNIPIRVLQLNQAPSKRSEQNKGYGWQQAKALNQRARAETGRGNRFKFRFAKTLYQSSASDIFLSKFVSYMPEPRKSCSGWNFWQQSAGDLCRQRQRQKQQCRTLIYLQNFWEREQVSLPQSQFK